MIKIESIKSGSWPGKYPIKPEIKAANKSKIIRGEKNCDKNIFKGLIFLVRLISFLPFFSNSFFAASWLKP
jgi:hypothetical protein